MTNQQVGTFCWWSLMTKDVERANQFYHQLFDWSLEAMPIPGHDDATIYAAQHGGFANPVPLDEGFPGPSHWIPYISVADVDAAAERVKELGGKVCVAPFDIPAVGRTAVLEDPSGAAFHVFSSADETDNLDMISSGEGEICWMELMAEHPEAVIGFYRDMFGWSFKAPMRMNDVDYYSFESDGKAIGGVLSRPPEVDVVPPAWMSYFSVNSVEQIASRVLELGGSVVVPKTAIPETGYFAVFADSTGAHASLFEMTN
ncbi:MAG: VOC family protein [Cyanobacteria bacterium P01_E01_bin.48]